MSETLVKHRLFWSFFILETEKWLGEMSSSGLHLCGLDFNGAFMFKKGEPKKYRYYFSYAKFESAPRSKTGKKSKGKDRGWEEISHNEKWSVCRSSFCRSSFCRSSSNVSSSAAIGEPEGVPNRRGLYLRNNSFLCLYALLSSIVLLIAFGIVFGFFAFIKRSINSSDEFFHGAIGIICIFAVLLLINFIIFLYLTFANSHILDDSDMIVAQDKAYNQFLLHKTFETWLEKLLIRDGDIVKRFRVFWILSPRRFENWLSRMENDGYNVYKVHKSGLIFYFIKSSPRKMRYCVVNSDGGNISRYLQADWRIVYSSTAALGHFGRIVLLSHAFETEPPVPFLNGSEYVSNAARIAKRCLISVFFLLIVSLAAFLSLIYFKASAAWFYSAGALCAIFSLLTIRLLLYLANSIIISHGGIFKHNSFK